MFIKQRLLYNFVYHVRIKLDKIISIKLTLLKPMSHFIPPENVEKWRNGALGIEMEIEMGIEMGALGIDMEHWREKD